MRKDRSLVITDPGIDDAVAIFYLASRTRKSFFISTYGNVYRNDSFRNLRLVLDIIGRENYLSRGTSHGPNEIIKPSIQKLIGIHRSDGLNGKYKTYRGKVSYSEKVIFVEKQLNLLKMFLENGRTIISLGSPDFLRIFLKKTEFFEKPIKIIVTGCFTRRGNFFSTDFNTIFNLGLVNELVKKFDVTIIPLEITSLLNFNELNFKADKKLSHDFLKSIIPENGKILHDVFSIYYFLNRSRRKWGREESVSATVNPLSGKIRFCEKGNCFRIVREVNMDYLRKDLIKSLKRS